MKGNLFKQIKNWNNYPEIQDIANAKILGTDFGAKRFHILPEIVPKYALTEIEKTFKDFNKKNSF
jgi:hypothetical protein